MTHLNKNYTHILDACCHVKMRYEKNWSVVIHLAKQILNMLVASFKAFKVG